MSLALHLLLLTTLAVLCGCSAFHKKSTSGIIEGDSPSIRYTNPESAGGRVGGR